MGKRILYIGGGREAQETLEKAKALGLEITYVQTRQRYRDTLAPLVDEAILIDYADPGVLIPLARALHAMRPFACAISLSEDALLAAARVRDALGLGGNGLATVSLLKDKAMMRERLNAAGVSPVRARRVETPQGARSFAREQGFPIILKPVDGSGSLGVFRITEEAQIDLAWKEIESLGIASVLAEEYLDGPEISVETFSFHGRHVILALTDKLVLPNHVEIGHSMPASLGPAEERQAVSLVREFLDEIGFREGPAHTEVKLTSRGPRIVESHDRPGGDRISELVRVAYGVDMKTMAFAWATGSMEPLESSPKARGGAAIRFLAPEPGVVESVSGGDEAALVEGIIELQLNVRPGQRIREIRESYDRSGHALAGGASAVEAVRRCEEALKRLRIVTA